MQLAGEFIDPHIVSNFQIASTQRIGGVSRAGGFPVLDIAHCVNDIWASIRPLALVQQASVTACKMVVVWVVTQRRFRAGVLFFVMLVPASRPGCEKRTLM